MQSASSTLPKKPKIASLNPDVHRDRERRLRGAEAKMDMEEHYSEAYETVIHRDFYNRTSERHIDIHV